VIRRPTAKNAARLIDDWPKIFRRACTESAKKLQIANSASTTIPHSRKSSSRRYSAAELTFAFTTK